MTALVSVQGNAGTARAARTPLPPPPDFPGTACSLPLLLYRCRIISVRGDLTAGDFAEKSHLSTHPRPCPQGVSLSTKNNPPIVSPVCITSPGSLSPPHLPLPRLLDSFALKMKAPNREREHIAPEFLDPQRQLSRWAESGFPKMECSLQPLHSLWRAENLSPRVSSWVHRFQFKLDP